MPYSLKFLNGACVSVSILQFALVLLLTALV